MLQKNQFLQNQWWLAGLLTLIVAIITAQSLLLEPGPVVPGGLPYTHYNNYLIFKQSWFHLIHYQDIYQLYPAEVWDLYKYSPTFSLLFAPLAYLPDAVGLFVWNLLNVLVLFFALWKLPLQSAKARLWMVGFIVVELVTSIQNSQSNGLMAGLIILAFIFLERKKLALAALCIVFTMFIKIFGVVGFALFIFYPNKPKAFAYTIGWTLLLAVLPLLVISHTQLLFLYKSWVGMLQNDHSASIGLSVEGWLLTWFGINAKVATVLAGAVLFCLPMLRFRAYGQFRFRLFFLASILVWIVIFNHKAESPTFVIAVSGIAIWYYSQQKNLVNTLLVAAVFLFTILSPTDLFPRFIRQQYVVPYVLKAVPCILVWFKILWDLLTCKPTEAVAQKL